MRIGNLLERPGLANLNGHNAGLYDCKQFSRCSPQLFRRRNKIEQSGPSQE